MCVVRYQSLNYDRLTSNTSERLLIDIHQDSAIFERLHFSEDVKETSTGSHRERNSDERKMEQRAYCSASCYLIFTDRDVQRFNGRSCLNIPHPGGRPSLLPDPFHQNAIMLYRTRH